jgi:GAF domain-containing protein
MEIAQQKLAWMLAMLALLIIVYKLDLRRTDIGKSAINKVKAGLFLNLAGVMGGIILRIGLSSGSFAHSVIFLVETIGGYVLGWTLVIWGLLHGLGSFFDSNGKLKLDLTVRQLSNKLSTSLLNGSGPLRIIEELNGELLRVISADAVTLHRVDENGQLRLSYSAGMSPASRNLIRMPGSAGNIYWACMTSGRPAIADNMFEIRLGKRLELSKGPASSALCLPTAFSGKTYGLVTVYRTGGPAFRDADCELLRIVGQGLGQALWVEYSGDAGRIETRYREIMSLAKRYFIAEKSLASALIKTAKLIHGHTPFEKIRLNVNGNGRPHYLDFKLSTGGVVSIGSGYFSKEDCPSFHSGAGPREGFNKITDSASYNALENEYRFAVNDGDKVMAELTIKVSSATADSKSLTMLGSALCREIAEFLRRETHDAMREGTRQRLGAIRFLLEKTQSGGGLPHFLENIASAVVGLMPATICRIFLVDGKQRLLRLAAMSQARDLEWPDSGATDLQLDSIDFCQQAFDSGVLVKFGSHLEDSKQSVESYSEMLPPGIRRGVCLPLTMVERVVGLIVIGEARQEDRSETEPEDEIFISTLARLISIFLTVYHGRPVQWPATGQTGKLTLRKRELQSDPAKENLSLSDRSRINGPLAGILASCEYLQTRSHGDISDVARFIDIIQRNATKIHSLTSETKKI